MNNQSSVKKKGTSNSDRRNFPRMTVRKIPLRITTNDDLKSTLYGKVLNLSQSGMAAVFKQPLPPLYQIIISTTLQQQDIKIEGETKWIHEIDKNEYQYGIEFKNEHETITEYIIGNLLSKNISDRRKAKSGEFENINNERRGRIRQTSQPESALTFLDKYIEKGQAPYTKLFVSNYDLFTFKLSCTYIWKCHYQRFIDFYNEHISSNHLEIGVGTGFLLEQYNRRGDDTRLAISDINENFLNFSSKRLANHNPEIYRIDVMKPIGQIITPFNSIGMNHVFHCLPGTMQTKSVVFEHLKELLNQGGMIFGTTVLNRGLHHTLLAKATMRLYNAMHVLRNLDDDLEAFNYVIKKNFKTSEVKVIGSFAFFWGRI